MDIKTKERKNQCFNYKSDFLIFCFNKGFIRYNFKQIKKN